MTKVNELLIPSISKLPGQKRADVKGKVGTNSPEDREFQNLLQGEMTRDLKTDQGIHLSTHAARRLQERNMNIDGPEYLKLKSAFEKLKNKGGQDSLVITDKAAYIVDVPNNKIVTAIDKGSVLENVFTKIDSTVIV